jgi:protein-L-isoaspartate O-methyltransferase
VIPVGAPNAIQQLEVYVKGPSGQVEGQHILPVRFVPVTGSLGN